MSLLKPINWVLRRPLATVLCLTFGSVVLLRGPLDDPPAVKEARLRRFYKERREEELSEPAAKEIGTPSTEQNHPNNPE